MTLASCRRVTWSAFGKFGYQRDELVVEVELALVLQLQGDGGQQRDRHRARPEFHLRAGRHAHDRGAEAAVDERAVADVDPDDRRPAAFGAHHRTRDPDDVRRGGLGAGACAAAVELARLAGLGVGGCGSTARRGNARRAQRTLPLARRLSVPVDESDLTPALLVVDRGDPSRAGEERAPFALKAGPRKSGRSVANRVSPAGRRRHRPSPRQRYQLSCHSRYRAKSRAATLRMEETVSERIVTRVRRPGSSDDPSVGEHVGAIGGSGGERSRR